MNIKQLMKEFIEDESGLTAVEYAIAGGLVVGGMVAAFSELGTNATGRIESLASAIGSNGQVDSNYQTYLILKDYDYRELSWSE